jgi:hypothetical protein
VIYFDIYSIKTIVLAGVEAMSVNTDYDQILLINTADGHLYGHHKNEKSVKNMISSE